MEDQRKENQRTGGSNQGFELRFQLKDIKQKPNDFSTKREITLVVTCN